jgi:tripartite-type tricarboxylate transporter receptor subunit TctC
MNHAVLRCLAFLLPLAVSLHASAQAYPARPIRMIVPFPPGGPADIIGRAAAFKLGDSLGQQIVVENRAGGGGNIAAELVLKSTPDGYTLFLLSSAIVANQSLYTRVAFSVDKDFTPIAPLGEFPLLLVAHPSLGVRDVKGLIALARAKPAVINYGSAGSGGGAHLAAESFKHAAGIDMVHIPYKGTGPAVLDLVGGQVSVMFASVPSVIQHVRAGKLNALAVTSSRRSPALADVPTIAETGLRGYELVSWFGIVGPAGMPAEIVSRLSSEIGKAVKAPDFQGRLAAEGGEALVMNPERFGEFIKTELVRWAKVVRDAGAKLD